VCRDHRCPDRRLTATVMTTTSPKNHAVRRGTRGV